METEESSGGSCALCAIGEVYMGELELGFFCSSVQQETAQQETAGFSLYLILMRVVSFLEGVRQLGPTPCTV